MDRLSVDNATEFSVFFYESDEGTFAAQHGPYSFRGRNVWRIEYVGGIESFSNGAFQPRSIHPIRTFLEESLFQDNPFTLIDVGL
jgi:hypothetical protein